MGHSALWWLGGAAGAAALLYWQVILAEGAYVGPRAVRLVYQLGARHYDEVHAPGQAAADAALRPLLRSAVATTARPTCLDIATGTGRVPVLLRSDPALGAVVAALDLAPLMLREARRKEQAAGHGPTVVWHLGEAGNLPWATAVFDLVTCLEALEYFPRPRRALAEMARVLRPGGTLVLSKVPDGWARLLPGRALTRPAMSRDLERRGLTDITYQAWQHGHYELVVARRRPA